MKLISSLAALLVSATPLLSPTPASAEAGYDGGFFLEGEKGDSVFRIRFNGRLQTRLTLELFEADDKDTEVSLAVQRARFGFEGYAFTKALTYKFQADFGGGKVGLKDYYWNYAFSHGAQLRAGQFKKPFSRQYITSSGRLELVDRAPTDRAFGSGRDIGLMLHNDYERVEGFEWAVGVFNGAGENVVPDVWQPLGVARVGYGNLGRARYSEGDLECADKPESCGLRWSVGASIAADGAMPEDGDEGQVVSELDVMLKASGFALSGAFFLDYDLGAEDAGGGLDKLGLYVQASYFIAGPRLLPAVRFASIMPDDDAEPSTSEVTLGIGLLPYKHNFKWQTDATMKMTELAGDATTDWVIRTEVQLAF